jgi:hypothetical protein
MVHERQRVNQRFQSRGIINLANSNARAHGWNPQKEVTDSFLHLLFPYAQGVNARAGTASSSSPWMDSFSCRKQKKARGNL